MKILEVLYRLVFREELLLDDGLKAMTSRLLM